MIMGRSAYSAVYTDDGKGTPIDSNDHAKVTAAMERGEATVVVNRVGYYGASEGRVWISVPRILRIEENRERGF